MKKRISQSFVLILLLLTVFNGTNLYAQKTKLKVDGEVVKSYIRHMAADATKGRKPLTDVYRECQEWAASKFEEWGLKPAGDDGTYFQNFALEGFRSSFAWCSGVPELTINGTSFLTRYGDFTVDDRSTPGKTITGEVVFAGYGISAPDEGFDEYSDIDVNGKIVLVFKGSPDGPAMNNMFRRRPPGGNRPPRQNSSKWSKYSSDDMKIKTAYDKGAAGIMLYDPENARPFPFRFGNAPMELTRDFIIVSTVNERIFQTIMWMDPQESSRGFNRRIEGIKSTLKKEKACSEATGAKATVKSYDSIKMYGPKYNNNIARNIIGKIPGTDRKLKNQYVILGGHFDHLGVTSGQIYNGADDNASGSAEVMEMARLLATSKFKPKRTVYFCLWDGEEMGLLGSRHFVKEPSDGVIIDNVVANFNMDMVGLGTKLGVPGALNFPAIWNVILKNQDPAIIDILQPSTAGPGGSDYAPFIEKGIESLAMMTSEGGGHPDYHDTGDDTDKIEADILQKVGQFVLQGTINVANEKKVNLLIADRQDLYDASQMKVTNINPNLEEPKDWRRVKAKTRADLTALMLEKLKELQEREADNNPFARFRRMMRRSNVATGVTLAALGSDTEMLQVAKNLLNFGRIDVLADDGKWFLKGVTEQGKKALKVIAENNIGLHFYKPSTELLNDLLSTVSSTVLINGIDSYTDEQLAAVKEKNVLIGINFDPANVSGCVAKLEKLKTFLGGAGNLVLCPLSNENLDTAKTKLYMSLLKKGWTKKDIYGIGGKAETRRGNGNLDKLGR